MKSNARALAPAVAARVASPHLDARVVVRRASRASVNMSLVSFVVARGVRAVGQRVGAETRASTSPSSSSSSPSSSRAVRLARAGVRARRSGASARAVFARDARAEGARAARAEGARGAVVASRSVGWRRGFRGGGEAAKTTSRRRAVVTSGARSFERDGARDRSRVVRGAASDAVEGAPVEKPKKVSNLVKRTVSAVFMLSAAAVVIFAGGWPWAIAMAAFNGAACLEYFTMVRAMNKELPYPPPEWCMKLCALACASLPLLLHYTGGRMTSIIVATVISFTGITAALIVNEESHFNEFSSSLFGLIYAGFLPTFWVKLRGMSGVPVAAQGSLLNSWPAWLGGPEIWSLGLAATITIALSVVSADVGAYAFGKNFGKNKLTAVSPNKTVEGAVGGLLACTGMCALLFVVMGWPGSCAQGALLGATVFLTSVFGDLLESVMKRNAKMKDSGNLIPGHGGLLDRFDSYIFTGAVTYFFVIAVLGGFRTIFSVGYY
mgnify:CR=1 FL=1